MAAPIRQMADGAFLSDLPDKGNNIDNFCDASSELS